MLVSAPTGSGKTWIAVQAIKKVVSEQKHAWYASPLKALSNSKYHEFVQEFGRENVGLITGDRKENTDARIIVGTTEILRNQLYDSMSKSSDFNAELVILDEAHYLGDIDRGVVWEEVMIYLPTRVRLLMLSATIPNDHEIASWLESIRNLTCHVVHSEKRPVPIYPLYQLPDGEIVPLSGHNGISPKIESFILNSQKKRFRRSQSSPAYADILNALQKFNLLPAVFFLKSRSECNNALYACRKHTVSENRSNRTKERFEQLLKKYPFLSDHIQLEYLMYHGVGSHHGGQLPHWKVVIERLMNEGCLDAIFSTSTVAAGVNFPARTVVLAQSDRFNGKEFVSLSSAELHQATGRAGRRGKDKIGFALMLHGPFQDPHLINELFATPPEPINSQIKINFSMCLNLLLSQTPEEINQLLSVSFAKFQKMDSLSELKNRKEKIFENLQQKLIGCCCENVMDIIEKTEQRDLLSGQLTRLKKQKRKYVKKCSMSDINVEEDEHFREINQKIEFLLNQIQKLPCSDCKNYQLCNRKKNRKFMDLVHKAKYFFQSYEKAYNVLWNEFTRHLDFLILNGFADNNGKLTSDGIWASKLRLDHPLIIAESIRKGMLSRLSPELLSGIIAVFVNDKFRDLDLDESIKWEKDLLMGSYYRMKNATEEIILLMKQHNFKVPNVQFWPAAALYNWARGETWENVIKLTSVDEGDLAMMIFRTADNLRQLTSLDETHPMLADKSRQCIKLLLREPVILPT